MGFALLLPTSSSRGVVQPSRDLEDDGHMVRGDQELRRNLDLYFLFFTFYFERESTHTHAVGEEVEGERERES